MHAAMHLQPTVTAHCKKKGKQKNTECIPSELPGCWMMAEKEKSKSRKIVLQKKQSALRTAVLVIVAHGLC
jgi:hypothetical protein